MCFPKIHCTHFQDFGIPQRGVWAKNKTENWKMTCWWLLSKTISRNVYILRSCEEDWMGPGSWDFDIWRERTTVLTFGIFGKYNNPPPFWKPTTQVLSRDLAMLRGLRMARIRPSRLRILNAGSKIQIGFTKISNFQKMFENVEKSTKTPKSTPHSYQQMLGLLVCIQ